MADLKLRRSLIRLAHQKPELRSVLLPLLGKTAGPLPVLDVEGQKKMVEAINGLLKRVKAPVTWKSFSETAVEVPVPKGFSSLFASIQIDIQWSRSAPGELVNGYVGWGYQHHNGQNGFKIGVVVFDPNGKEGQKYGWRNDSGGKNDWGFVG